MTGMGKAVLLAVVTALCGFAVPSSGAAEDAEAWSSDACGIQPLKPDGSRWECTFADDFDGTSLDRSRWTPLVQAGPPDGACNLDSPRTHRVADGALWLTILPTSAEVVCPARPDGSRAQFASASISTVDPGTFQKFSQQYGRFEVRYRNTETRAPGLHEAFWLWPDHVSNFDLYGELDIVETYSGLPDSAIPYLHDGYGREEGVNTTSECRSTRGEWHTYTLEWSAERIEIFVDGKSCLVNTTTTHRFRTRYTMALTLLLGTAWNAYDGRAPMPATMEVDYVRVWR